MICTFIGPRFCDREALYPVLKKEIENLIASGVDVFYSGGYGAFDLLALRVVGELKAVYPHIQNILVFAYLTEKHISQYRDILIAHNAESIYPFENTPLPRYAIIKRNEWMIKESDFVISGTKIYCGGSGVSFEYAEKSEKKIIFVINY